MQELTKETNQTEIALYLIPTPIGNYDDMTLRGIKILSSVDIIACEDTRHSGLLLKHFNIFEKKLESYHEHNEKEKSVYLIEQILNGKSVAVITDAGTPGISDPAYRLVKLAIENNIKIIPLPGASAMLPSLIASGLPTDRFVFCGFPPQKKGRHTFLTNILQYDTTIILYESPYRIIKLLEEFIKYGYENMIICVSREISKMFEEHIRGSVSQVLDICKNHKNLKGEFVVVINPIIKDN